MEELKMIVDMIAHLPTLATWVLVGFLFYKLMVVGSLFGLARLIVVKLHDGLTNQKPKQMKLGVKTVNEEVAVELTEQLGRLSTTNYIYHTDVRQLKDWLDSRRP